MNGPTQTIAASLSTMWAISNFQNLDDFFLVAGKMGFQEIELNHQVNSKMLAGCDLDHYQFSSVHEPCPADITTKELVSHDWLISSSDETSRKRGVESIKKSIKLAYKIGARVVVIHCGNVSPMVEHERELRDIFDSGDVETDSYQSIKSQLIQFRGELVAPRIRAVVKSIDELLKYADQYTIQLGLENRYHYLDIPSIDEMESLLALAEPNRLGFIYDIGHAQALDRLGFFHHEEWLERYSARMYGAHLHDVIGLADHYAPGSGEFDFTKIARFLPENAFRTIEIVPSNTIAQIKHGIAILLDAGCVKYQSMNNPSIT